MLSLRETFKRLDENSRRRNYKEGGSILDEIIDFGKDVGKELVLDAAGLSDKDKAESSSDLDAKLLAYLEAQKAAETDIEIEPVEAGFASSSIQSVKAEDAPPMKRFAGETLETSDIDLSALSQIDFLKSFDDIKIKAEGPRGTTINIDSPL
tara:strand:+ start:259 stop:714 length:456 start_codon:yes stop_codon:yes gene_type:complete